MYQATLQRQPACVLAYVDLANYHRRRGQLAKAKLYLAYGMALLEDPEVMAQDDNQVSWEITLVGQVQTFETPARQQCYVLRSLAALSQRLEEAAEAARYRERRCAVSEPEATHIQALVEADLRQTPPGR